MIVLPDNSARAITTAAVDLAKIQASRRLHRPPAVAARAAQITLRKTTRTARKIADRAFRRSLLAGWATTASPA
ncbi:MAG: hypothetical protein WDM87_13115 [Terracidiphilus sp.]